MTLFFFYALVVVLGILSMGFQMLGSRLLNPHFGSSIITWAWLIATFLAAFSTGSVLGGWITGLRPASRERAQLVVAGLAVLGLELIALYGPEILERIEYGLISVKEMGDANHRALFASCFGLFFLPVTALSSFGPQCVHYLSTRRFAPGLASGLVYGINTLGNIAGVMLTSFVLIPNEHLGTARLLYIWLGVAFVTLAGLLCILRTPPPPSSVPSSP